jgi:hypothetical protein
MTVRSQEQTAGVKRLTADRPLNAGRLVVLFVAALVGCFVVSALHLASRTWILNTLTAAQYETFSLAMTPPWLLSPPLGVALALRLTGPRLGVRGRFWPALGLSLAARVATTYVPKMCKWRIPVDWSAAAILALVVVGGMAGFILSRRRVLPTEARVLTQRPPD